MIQYFFLTKGGYNLDSIAVSALAVTRILLGEAPDQLASCMVCEEATETVWQVAKEQSKYWKSVEPRACEPREGLSYLLCSGSQLLVSRFRV